MAIPYPTIRVWNCQCAVCKELLPDNRDAPDGDDSIATNANVVNPTLNRIPPLNIPRKLRKIIANDRTRNDSLMSVRYPAICKVADVLDLYIGTRPTPELEHLATEFVLLLLECFNVSVISWLLYPNEKQYRLPVQVMSVYDYAYDLGRVRYYNNFATLPFYQYSFALSPVYLLRLFDRLPDLEIYLKKSNVLLFSFFAEDLMQFIVEERKVIFSGTDYVYLSTQNWAEENKSKLN